MHAHHLRFSLLQMFCRYLRFFLPPKWRPSSRATPLQRVSFLASRRGWPRIALSHAFHTSSPRSLPQCAGTSTADDLEELRLAFTNERFAPELLMHRDDLIKRVRQAVDEQARTPSPSTPAVCHTHSRLHGSAVAALVSQQDRIAELEASDSLSRMIYETEVERVCFLLRSYLRTRIVKIQSQALYLARDEEAQGRLSEPEAAFAAQYAALYQRHVDREAWALGDTSRLPEALKQITSISTIAAPPNLESHVFCVATRDCPAFAIDGTAEMIELLRGQVALLPYAPLRPLIDEGSVVLA